ncbi:MAG: alpha/beta hydrolase [Clostridia bacterium]|nr:alpha/beta hydrolase [Clostridia bacterium]
MERIANDWTIERIMAHPQIEAFGRYLIYSGAASKGAPFRPGTTLESLRKNGWSPEGMAAGLNALAEAAAEGRASRHFLYEGSEDPDMRHVHLLRLSPKAPDPKKPAVVLCAGGGYMSVCTLVESLPSARHFLEQGYTVFLLTYRVNVPGAALLALDDMAAAVRWLCEHAGEFGLRPGRYVAGGFSAGANLVSNWGSASLGWKKYGCPKPLCLIPVYTYICLKDESGLFDYERESLFIPMFGEDWRAYLDRFDVISQIDGEYPPCYIVCGKDDAEVPCVNSERLKRNLDAAGTPSILDEGEHAPHGFGDGTGTDVEGWPERAMAFIQSL